VGEPVWQDEMALAITHVPSPRLAACELTFVARSAIDYDRAMRQHADYCCALGDCGATVRSFDVNADLADCVFVEDTFVVLDEVAIRCSLGAPSRRPEAAGIEPELARLRPIERVELPATLEGGDVLRIDRTLLVGLSSRTNAAGVETLARIAGRYGYDVRAVPVHGCLHLKTACTALPDGRLLVNPAWVDAGALRDFEQIDIPPTEPWGGNIVCLGNKVIAAAENVQTVKMIRDRDIDVRTVELDEFAKAEGGVTCLSILLRDDDDRNTMGCRI
jgi:dimethylargininase